MDKAGKQYWDEAWEAYDIPKEMNPRYGGLANYVNRRLHEYFCQIFSNISTHGKKLLEIGCARSIWLPYFAEEFGFQVCGIDYSEIGCRQAAQILAHEGVEGKVIGADFFSPPESVIGAFDTVVSFGVLEHYEDTTACIKGFSKFLKPGGMLITNIPNLVGLMGVIQKYLNRGVYNIHVPLSPEDLCDAHRKNRLQVISCDYFLVVDLGLLSLENLKYNAFLSRALRLRSWINRTVWAYERLIPLLKPNRWSSPYINCVAVKE